ncbi:MAG: bacteriocin family protein [Myxococcales bacterium]|nr:bacteriocin family protein [Myxococcales bacterium]
MSHAFLNHADTPLSDKELERLHESVVVAARRRLVGRRFIEMFGPMGPGVQAVPYDEFTGEDQGAIDLTGEIDTGPVITDRRTFKPLPIIHKDFIIHWRDLEMWRQLGMPVDDSAAAGAATWCAEREDRLIFHGNERLGFEGLMTHPERHQQPLTKGWAEPGAALQDVVAATGKMYASGHFGPYAMAVSPQLFANLHRMWEDARTMEIDNVRRLVADGIFRCDVLEGDSAVIVSTGRENMDIAVGLDMTVAYLGAEKMNHPFRVLETLCLRIKHADAICTLG